MNGAGGINGASVINAAGGINGAINGLRDRGRSCEFVLKRYTYSSWLCN